MALRDVLTLARIAGEVVELRHDVVAKLGVGVLVPLRALAGLDVLPLADAQRLPARLLYQLRPAYPRGAEQRSHDVHAVWPVAACQRPFQERRERREEIDLRHE